MKLGVKVKEKIARTIADKFTTNEIVNVFKDANIATNTELYAKWKITLDAFSKVSTEEGLFHIIEEFCHPLNFTDLDTDSETREKFIEKLNKILTYESLEIQSTERTAKIKTTTQIASEKRDYEARLDNDLEVSQSEIEEAKIDFENDLLTDIKDAEALLNTHQSFMDIIELFCQNTKKPTKELNEPYLFLAGKIKQIIKDLKLQSHEIHLYMPFTDLYSAEIEWNGSGREFEIRLGPKLSWDVIRPSLHNVHSKITQLIIDIRNSHKDDDKKTDDEKHLEQINALISEKRSVKTVFKVDNVKKMEILHKYEDKKAPKKVLKNSVIRFDDSVPAIFVDEIEIPLPEYGKEHFFCRAVWKRKANEATDWSKIYNDMEAKNSDFLPDKELWRYVYDAKNDVNKRIKDIIETNENLFDWNEKTIKRLY